MDFLKNHVEKVLFVVLLAVLGGSVFLAMNAKSNLQRDVLRSPNAGNVEFTLDTEKVQEIISHLQDTPPQLAVVTNAFTPGARVNCKNPNHNAYIPKEAEVCPYCGYEQNVEVVSDTDGDGIPDDVEALWGMDINDPRDAYGDVDGDGFSNLLEYQLGFDGSDPNSHPPLIDYLRLEAVAESSVEFELRGIARLGEVYTLQLNWKYPDEDQGQTQYIKEGSTFGRNNEFKVASYTEKRPLIDGRYVDQSEALITSGSHKLILRRTGDRRKGMITESTATLHLIMGPEWRKDVRVNETMELDKKSYNIVDISRTAVVLKPDVQEPDSAEPISIRKATQEELDALEPPEPEIDPESPMQQPPTFEDPSFF